MGGVASKVVIRDDDLGAAAELVQAVLGDLGGLDLDIDGVRAVAHREIQNGKLLLDAAVESAVVLVPAAGGQQNAVGELLQELRDSLRAFAGILR